MVREPHRTHGNKTRICSFTDSRTTICALCHTPTPLSILSPLVFRCPFHTVPQNNHYLQRAPPGHTCHGVTPGTCMSYPHRLLSNTIPSPNRLSCVSLLMTGFPVTPPEPGPAPSQASGFRPSGLLTPVSPGVPTGARNLGVCDFSLLLPFQTSPLVSRPPLAVLHPTSATVFPRFLSILCYRSLVPSQSALHTPHCYRPPTFVYPHFSRTLVFP